MAELAGTGAVEREEGVFVTEKERASTNQHLDLGISSSYLQWSCSTPEKLLLSTLLKKSLPTIPLLVYNSFPALFFIISLINN